ncbi:MAG: ParB/RepB/Spo0J family partition protein [Oribacterium sp.]|nr:ParB/RepB/Spo0J family partition protein [Oribacterium sp.]
MAAKKQLPDRVQLKTLDSLFGIDEEQAGQIMEVPINELFSFQNHPFKVLDDEKMVQTVESIRENGILVPIMVRSRQEGGYEVISGHRRRHAAEIVGLETVPVIIRELTDDEAVIAMVDANLQREEILPSEKAYAYKMKLEALKHKAGRPSKENSCQVGTNFRADEAMAETANESARTIQRYIRLTELLPELMEMVDSKKIKLNPAVEISYLSPNEQYLLIQVIDEDGIFPSLSQAQQIKKLSQDKACTKEAIHALLSVAGIKERNVVIKHEVIMQYFPADVSDAEVESLIVRLLDEYRKKHGGM